MLNYLQDNYYPTIGLDANKCQIYYNTIDLSQFTPEAQPEAQQLLEQERTLKIEINNITNDINYINKNYGPENLQGLNKELIELNAIINQNPGNKYANDNSIKIKGFIDDINNKRSILPQLESELPQLQLQLKQLQLQIEQLKQKQSQI
jgi:chromosome segregation ATPase